MKQKEYYLFCYIKLKISKLFNSNQNREKSKQNLLIFYSILLIKIQDSVLIIYFIS